MIPAYAHADIGFAGLKGLKSQIAGREVEFFVVAGIIGDMHFSVATDQLTIAFDDYRCVVKNAGITPLKQAGNQHHVQLGSQLAQA